jgi:hypothetical protein
LASRQRSSFSDELGQVRGPRDPLFEALTTSTAGQLATLQVIISTQAPTDNDLLSVLIDDAIGGHDARTVCSLYTAPAAADPLALETNPPLGVFQNPSEVLAMAEDARRMPARAAFRNLILNQRVEASSPFIMPVQWQGAPARRSTSPDAMCSPASICRKRKT